MLKAPSSALNEIRRSQSILEVLDTSYSNLLQRKFIPILLKSVSISQNYKFTNSEGLYFVSFAVVGWLDVFTRNEYKDLLLENLEFSEKSKGMEIDAVLWQITCI